MAQSTCPRCGEHAFELAIENPKGSSFPLAFIRCANCGTVVGVLEHLAAGQTAAAVGDFVTGRLNSIMAELAKIAKAVKA